MIDSNTTTIELDRDDFDIENWTAEVKAIINYKDQ